MRVIFSKKTLILRKGATEENIKTFSVGYILRTKGLKSRTSGAKEEETCTHEPGTLKHRHLT